jgi:hypothetical protein
MMKTQDASATALRWRQTFALGNPAVGRCRRWTVAFVAYVGNKQRTTTARLVDEPQPLCPEFCCARQFRTKRPRLASNPIALCRTEGTKGETQPSNLLGLDLSLHREGFHSCESYLTVLIRAVTDRRIEKVT